MIKNFKIGNYLFAYRIRNKLTQKQLGKIIKASQSQISRWEWVINKPNKFRAESILKILRNE